MMGKRDDTEFLALDVRDPAGQPPPSPIDAHALLPYPSRLRLFAHDEKHGNRVTPNLRTNLPCTRKRTDLQDTR